MFLIRIDTWRQHGQDFDIWSFPKKPDAPFEDKSEILNYLKKDLFESEHGRYRYTQSKEADIIVISFDGEIIGYLSVVGSEEPNEKDKIRAPRSKRVYLISQSNIFKVPVKASDFNLAPYQFGKYIEEDTFEVIKSKGGSVSIHS